MNYLLLAIAFLLPNNAFAYIDPGSGSVLLQLLLAGIVGAGMFIKMYWNRFIAIFSGKKNDNQDSPK